MKPDDIENKFNHFISKFKLDDKQINNLFDTIQRKRIKCSWCGKKAFQKGVGWFEGGKIDLTFGYGSRYDMQNIDAHICDNCYEKKFPPKDQKYNKSILQLLSEEMAKCSTPQEKERAKKRFFTKLGKQALKDRKIYNSRNEIYD